MPTLKIFKDRGLVRIYLEGVIPITLAPGLPVQVRVGSSTLDFICGDLVVAQFALSMIEPLPEPGSLP